ncbi:MAG: hypothetical protein E7561_06185 [Ruminococcaceae bacterium]|nr:hypothetical protein [Oscillospiraceae bacterium]
MKKAINQLSKLTVLFVAIVLVLSVMPTTAFAAKSGKTYYVSVDGKDDNDGLSKDKPLSFKMANATLFKGGDKVLFKRGDTFYGLFAPIVASASKDSRVTFDAYGKGDLPKLSFAKIVSKAWENAGNGFYKIDLTDEKNYSGAKSRIANVGFFTDDKGNYYGMRKKDAASCVDKYDFYCDDTYIYLKTDKEPYAELGTLKMAIHESLFKLAPCINVKNLHLEYCGYGMTWGRGDKDKRNFVDITNCVIENMGGTVIDEKNFTRAGNGIELFDSGSNVVIKNNIFRTTYDVAFTCQGSEPGTWKNISITDNIFAYNTQAIEFWCGKEGNGGIYNLVFENNLCIKQGEHWGTIARPGKFASTDLLMYGFKAPAYDVTMRNNTFYHSTDEYAVIYYSPAATVEKFLKNFKINNNYIYHLKENSTVFFVNDDAEKREDNRNFNFKEWQEMSQMDKDTTFTAIGDNLSSFADLEKIALESNDYNEIVKAAIDSGLTVKARYSDEYEDKKDSDKEDSSKDKDDNKSEVKEENKSPMNIKTKIYIILGSVVTVVVAAVVVVIILTGKNPPVNRVDVASKGSESDNNTQE